MKYRLRLSESHYSALRAHLFSDDQFENGAFLLCGRSESAQTTQLLARNVIQVAPKEYIARTPSHLEISSHFVNNVVTRATQFDLSVIVAHSHPAAARATFSPSDDFGEQRLMPVLYDIGGRTNASLLLTSSAWNSHVWSGRKLGSLEAIDIRGSRIETIPRHEKNSPLKARKAFDRQLRVWGKAGQRRLADLTVGIVGLGGTGSSIAEQLTRLGVRRFMLVDNDSVDLSNITRMYGTEPRVSVGKSKVESLAKYITKVSLEDVAVRIFIDSVVRRAVLRALADCDVVFSCTDTLLSRAVLNRFSYQYLVPVIDLGVRIDARGQTFHGASGRVTLVGPDLACLRCSGYLDPDLLREELLTSRERSSLEREGYIKGDWDPQPAVISLNTTVAGLAVTALLNMVNQFYTPQVEQLYDVSTGEVFVAGAVHRKDCEICSATGLIGLGDVIPVSTFE